MAPKKHTGGPQANGSIFPFTNRFFGVPGIFDSQAYLKMISIFIGLHQCAVLEEETICCVIQSQRGSVVSVAASSSKAVVLVTLICPYIHP